MSVKTAIERTELGIWLLVDPDFKPTKGKRNKAGKSHDATMCLPLAGTTADVTVQGGEGI